MALKTALNDKTMEVYDSFDRANFKTNISSFISSGSYLGENTIKNHLERLMPKLKNQSGGTIHFVQGLKALRWPNITAAAIREPCSLVL